MTERSPSHDQRRSSIRMTLLIVTLVATIAPLGIMAGDPGTSVLYTMKLIMAHLEWNPENILEATSAVIWVLTILGFYYAWTLIEIHHHGEGGNPALVANILRYVRHPWGVFAVVVAGLAGVYLLLVDGGVTPAISVMASVEGAEHLWPEIKPYTPYIAAVILFALYSFQSVGTKWVGRLFGPIMVAWFGTIGTLGAMAIWQNPRILLALNPYYAFRFVTSHPLQSATIAAIALVGTGVEGFYADRGHFAERNAARIKHAWLVMWPTLVLNYLGQGAHLMTNPGSAADPFYAIVPAGLYLYVLGISLAATVIASQSLISGAFSNVKQMVEEGKMFALRIINTDADHHGQVYVPAANFGLALFSMGLTLYYRESEFLGEHVYGLSVYSAMAVNALLFMLFLLVKGESLFAITRKAALPTVIIFGLLYSNWPKVYTGGALPLVLAGLLLLGSIVWMWHNNGVRARRKQPIPHLHHQLEYEVGVVCVGDYADIGTALLLAKANGRHMRLYAYHALTHLERKETIQEYINEACRAAGVEGVEVVIDTCASGDIPRCLVHFLSQLGVSPEQVQVYIAQSTIGRLHERTSSDIRGALIPRLYAVDTTPYKLETNGSNGSQVVTNGSYKAALAPGVIRVTQ